MRAPTFTELIDHPSLLAPFYAGSSWDRWKAVGKAIFAEPMSASEVALFHEVAQREPPVAPVRVVNAVVGRGGGKDSIAAAIAIKLALGDYRGRLRPGEKGVVAIIAVNREQAAVEFGYIRANMEECAILAGMIADQGAEWIELDNGVVIEVHTASYRSVRGRSLIAVILDECAFFRDENSASPDVELFAALKPGLARMPGSVCIMISTAHRRAGLLYQHHKMYFGTDNAEALAVLGTTLQFNPSFDAGAIEKDLARDRQLYGAEYLSEWRDDLSSYIGRELLDAAVDVGVVTRAPVRGVRYIAGCDPSGGTGSDAFTAAISHREGNLVVLDVLFERKPPLNPASVIDEIAALMTSYGVREITGDRYAAGFVLDAFKKAGKTYLQSERDRSAIYIDTLPLFSAGRARLLDHQRLVSQFAALERRTFSTGRDRVNHPDGKGHHDDLANSAAIALTLAASGAGTTFAVPEGYLKKLRAMDRVRVEYMKEGFAPSIYRTDRIQ